MPMRFLHRRRPADDDDDDDDDDLEQTSFLNTGVSRRVGSSSQSYGSNVLRCGYAVLTSKPIAVVAVVALFAFVAVSLRKSTHEMTPNGGDAMDAPTTIRNNSTEPLFACPASFESLAEDNENFEENYTWQSKNITKNKTEFLETFRTTNFDAWGTDYNTLKNGSTPFKSKYYPKYLKPGMKLYESACGIGLNLYMTLEILRDHNISGITVYGNDYVTASEEATRTVLADGVIPEGNHKGVICAADSLNLSHVPSNTFDVVYTGYLTPLQDSLQIMTPEEYNEEDYSKWNQICAQVASDKPEDWMGKTLWKEAVELQHDWFGQWVAEMARIAKPGAPVIVEQVSYSYCGNKDDWDGVEKDFWNKSATSNEYDWNIDPASIEIMDLTFRETRYEVFMLKKNDTYN